MEDVHGPDRGWAQRCNGIGPSGAARLLVEVGAPGFRSARFSRLAAVGAIGVVAVDRQCSDRLPHVQQTCLTDRRLTHMPSGLHDAVSDQSLENRMAHNWSCAEAKNPGCDCACGGAGHGCRGAFKIADGPLDGVLELVKQREDAWDPRGVKPTRPTRQAVIGCGQAEVVHWLHRDRGLLYCAWTTQTVAFEEDPSAPAQGMVLRRVDEHLGSELMAEFQKWALAKHFWCELLAQMACAIAQYEILRGRIFRTVESLIEQQHGQTFPDALRNAGSIGSAVHWAWRYVLPSVVAASGAGSLATVLASGDLERLLWPIRVIAVLMCPDASDHAMVREHCWYPVLRLARAEVRGAVRERFTQVFREDPWFGLGHNAPS
ncbi:hypothetical protein LUW76_22820 [Actinomadura madurae]|uniref:hypothetical protein n=1 Tax=Actinomadura madurae TaxID=1993 RepID=UPI0020268498|nr:hypothetical protein [Actinomadura madurae]URM96953.1 hypothetical protein LUW76_22820 [Actinomadura madurae]